MRKKPPHKYFYSILLALIASSFVIAHPITIPDIWVTPHHILANASEQKQSLTHNTIITRQKMIRSGAHNIQQILSSQGGIQLQDLTGDGTHLVISQRGFGENAASNSLILINGIPYTNPDLAPPNLSIFNNQDIEKIIITPSSESVLYGDQAVGGVINIITRQPQKLEGNAALSYGSYHHHIEHINLGDRFANGFDFRISGSHNATNNYREHNRDTYNNTFLQLGYHYNKGNIQFNLQNFTQHLLFAGALTATQVKKDRRQAQNYKNFSNNNQNIYNLDWQHFFSTTARVNTHFQKRDAFANGFLFGNFHQDLHTYLALQRYQIITDNNTWQFGENIQHDQYQLSSIFGMTRSKQTQLGTYVLLLHHLSSLVSAELGAHAATLQGNLQNSELSTTHNNAIISTVGLLFNLTHQVTFYIKRAGNFRFPKIDENALALNKNGLKTQTGASYEAGINWQLAQQQINIHVYQLNLTNEIAFDPLQTPQFPMGTNRNLPPTQRTGFSLSTHYRWNSYLAFNGEYHYVDARFGSGANKGKKIPFVAANFIQLSSDITLTPHWDFYLETQYTGKRYAAADDANQGTVVPDFAVVNFNLLFHLSKFSASFRVNNIFNEIYNAYVTYSPFSQSEFFYPAPTRNYLLTVNFSLS